MIKTRAEKRIVRKRRVRAKIYGTESRPRLSVFKSNKAVYAQIINDDNGTTIVSFDSRKAKASTPKEKAKEVGIEIAKLALAKDITAVVFDRSGYLYTGVIKTLADGAREGGLKF